MDAPFHGSAIFYILASKLLQNALLWHRIAICRVQLYYDFFNCSLHSTLTLKTLIFKGLKNFKSFLSPCSLLSTLDVYSYIIIIIIIIIIIVVIIIIIIIIIIIYYYLLLLLWI